MLYYAIEANESLNVYPFMSLLRISVDEGSLNDYSFVEGLEPNFIIEGNVVPTSLPTIDFEFGPIRRAVEEANVILFGFPVIFSETQLSPKLAWKVVAPSRLRVSISRNVSVEASAFVTPTTLQPELYNYIYSLETPNVPLSYNLSIEPERLQISFTSLEIDVNFGTRVIGGLEGTIVATTRKLRANINIEGISPTLAELWETNNTVTLSLELFGEGEILAISGLFKVKPRFSYEDYKGDYSLRGNGYVDVSWGVP